MTADRHIKVLCVFGTRPEAIKLAPVIRALERTADPSDTELGHVCATVRVCVTGQHREMLDQMLAVWGITPHHDLSIMRPNQTLSGVAAATMAALEPVFEHERPDWILVQGDTTSAAAASLAGFYSRIRVAHVEAGLRTGNRQEPYPEEINRRLTAIVADRHFAPTQRARRNLLGEGVPPSQIFVTGNTAIDALYWTASALVQPDDQPESHLGVPASDGESPRVVLVTAHRRENLGEPLEQICLAVSDLANRYGSRIHVVFPVHLNPNVQRTVRDLLGGIPNVSLLSPLDYVTLVSVLRRSYLVLTDSGGIQEEAPALGVPVLVLRDVTERPEAVDAGAALLVGPHRSRIFASVVRLMEDADAYRSMARAVSPYGDGRAAQRIVDSLLGRPVREFGAGRALGHNDGGGHELGSLVRLPVAGVPPARVPAPRD